MRQDREPGFACGARHPPNGETTQADTDVMGVTRQAPTAATSGLVGELKAQGEEQGEDAFDKRFAVATELNVGRFIVEIDGDGAVVPRLCGGCGPCVTPRSSGLVS
jgi:hypothetical protein